MWALLGYITLTSMLGTRVCEQWRDLLFGVGSRAGIDMSAVDTNLAAGVTLIIFVFKDVVSEIIFPVR